MCIILSMRPEQNLFRSKRYLKVINPFYKSQCFPHVYLYMRLIPKGRKTAVIRYRKGRPSDELLVFIWEAITDASSSEQKP